MDIFVTILFFPVFGSMSIFAMLFSQVYFAVQVCLFLVSSQLPAKIKNFSQWVLGVSSIILWLSIFVFRHDLPETPDLTSCSAAGFPFRIFTYPCGAMGGDYVPLKMWWPFYLNYFVWIIVSALLLRVFMKYNFLKNIKAKRILGAAYVIINLAGLGMLLLAFD